MPKYPHKKHELRYNPPKPKEVSLADEGIVDKSNVTLRMFDPDNPDTGLFNVIDGELVALAGSELVIYRYAADQDFDDLYDEHRRRVLYKKPELVVGHYDPRPVEENLSEFGIELTNDQTFTFNKTYIERKLKGPVIAGDVIKPKFQNIYFEVFEVQEDSFEAYGVFHLVCAAKIMRDVADIIDGER